MQERRNQEYAIAGLKAAQSAASAGAAAAEGAQHRLTPTACGAASLPTQASRTSSHISGDVQFQFAVQCSDSGAAARVEAPLPDVAYCSRQGIKAAPQIQQCPLLRRTCCTQICACTRTAHVEQHPSSSHQAVKAGQQERERAAWAGAVVAWWEALHSVHFRLCKACEKRGGTSIGMHHATDRQQLASLSGNEIGRRQRASWLRYRRLISVFSLACPVCARYSVT